MESETIELTEEYESRRALWTLPLEWGWRAFLYVTKPLAESVSFVCRHLWWPVFLSASVLGVGGTSLHFISHGYVELEKEAQVGVQDAWASAVRMAAETTGFELATPTTPGVPERVLAPVEEVEISGLKSGFSAAFARAQYKKEGSKGNPKIRSPKGAIGLMQITPATGKRMCGMSEKQLEDAHNNAECWGKIMRLLTDQYGDVYLALLDYNGGPRAVDVVGRCNKNIACMGGYDESFYYARDILLWSSTDIRG